MSYLPISTILNMVCVSFLGVCHAATPSLPRAEQEVIEAFLRTEDGVFGPFPEGTLFEATSLANLDSNGSYEQVQKDLHRETPDRGPAFAQAVEDMLKKNQTAARIAPTTNTPRPVHLISEDAFKNIFSDTDVAFDDWLTFYETLANCGRILITSRVGFDSNATVAVLCYGLKNPLRPIITRLQVLCRARERWMICEHETVMWPKGTNMVSIRCELRYYVAYLWSAGSAEPLALRVLKNSGTNLVCSVPQSFRLVDQMAGGLEFKGWVLQTVEPAEYAGQPLTAVLDDYLPSKMFRFGRLYDIEVPKNLIGDLNFHLRF